MLFSFFLAHEAETFALNLNLLETNIINIFLLIGLLIYVKSTALDPGLKERQQEIYRQLENTKKDIFNSTEYYYLAEQAFSQNTFWLQSWQEFYKEEKYTLVNTLASTSFGFAASNIELTKNVINTLEKKSFLALQKYLLYIVTGKILRKFLTISEKDQSQLIESTLVKLRG